MAHTISLLTTTETAALQTMLVIMDLILVGISIISFTLLRRGHGRHAVRGHGRRRASHHIGHRA